MHLWPSMSLRDSFKEAYLKKLDWNLNRMNKSQKQSADNNNNNQHKPLLVDDDDGDSSESGSCRQFALLCREILMILSCCYCCFCCGACIEDEGSS